MVNFCLHNKTRNERICHKWNDSRLQIPLELLESCFKLHEWSKCDEIYLKSGEIHMYQWTGDKFRIMRIAIRWDGIGEKSPVFNVDERVIEYSQ